MIFSETPLKGAHVVDLKPLKDERGFFSRTWCQHEFEDMSLTARVVQCNLSFNHKKGTLRGMHYQVAPYEETKLVRCTKGAIYDVIVDLRPDSDTFRQWFGVELTEENHSMLFVPEGFAHGFQTLTDDAEVFYQVSQFYQPGAERGLRWNDPAIGIEWPLKEGLTLSQKDQAWPDFDLQALSLRSTANV